MEFEMKPHIVYVKTDAHSRVTAVDSSAFLRDAQGWTEIDRGLGTRYGHAQGNYFPKPIMDERGIWRYKMEGGKAIERTEEEMDADYVPPAHVPSDAERITALETQLASYEAAYAEGVNEA